MGRKAGSKSRNYPAHTLEQALPIINAIVDMNAGKPMDRLLVAQAINRTPSSSEFKKLLSSSRWYGLTTGTEKADVISPTELGLKIAKPEQADEVQGGLVEACLTPDLFGQVYRHFNRNKWPEAQFLQNTLEKSFDVDSSFAEEATTLLSSNAKFVGILQDISGSLYIRIEDPTPGLSASGSGEVKDDTTPGAVEAEITQPAVFERLDAGEASPTDPPATHQERQRKKFIFVAHGKNHKPLEGLKKILDQFSIEYKVAIDEPNAGRPISAKVAALMNDCSAGIFIFTKDEKFSREDEAGTTQEVWRPSENVVYELGAASVLWDKKIIILREEGVNFPSDFSDLGYITFHDGDLSSKALDLMKELIGLGLVVVQAA